MKLSTNDNEAAVDNPIVTLVENTDAESDERLKAILGGRRRESRLGSKNLLHEAYEELRTRGWVKDPDAPKPAWPPDGKMPPSWKDPKTGEMHTVKDAMRIEAGRIRRCQ